MVKNRKIIIFWSALGIFAAIITLVQFLNAWNSATGNMDMQKLQHIIALNMILPRSAMAIICGAGLALSGLLLQQILRNPLAEPTTLGIASGAQLAMTLGILYMPATWLSREWLALIGAFSAILLVLLLNRKRQLEPASVILSGMIISLTATAASTALILANGDYVFSLFVWGGGSLEQLSWTPFLWLSVKIIIGVILASFLLRPLTLFNVDDANMRSLGVSFLAIRLLVIMISVSIAAFIIAEVGILGFVGLVGPALARLSGARSLKQMMVASPIIGAILLWATDSLTYLIQTLTHTDIPVGAATALLSGPLLLWMLPKLRMFEWPNSQTGDIVRRARHPFSFIAILVIILMLVTLSALTLGRGTQGIFVATGTLFYDFIDLRFERLLFTMISGACLALAGALLQRLTANPLASPEILGTGLGAGVGLALVLLTIASPSLAEQWMGAAIGAFISILFIMLLAMRGQFGSEKLLLAGVGFGAMASSVLTALIATGTPQGYALLGWLSGTTTQATSWGIAFATVILVVALFIIFALSRWITILPLGDVAMRSLGLPNGLVRAIIVVTATSLTAIGSLMIGPLSFVGLIAPHIARYYGINETRSFMIASALLGAVIMAITDWLSRIIAFPYNLPPGLFASLIGGFCLILILSQRSKNAKL
ncbi:Fe(3+)-hydroxamate ABC transporter permease FhuB [Bartonella sp. HY038]|uniref:Fe(3+)-hydroxamate ABC transporter permease FhuB n=1 Tax=Bartonella sp. HY038 TaxID=2759660 RepID=UPI0015F80787|nr:Fe(3+)-hydroxamate ABC transporter permease FhuB [Bartonella sp. HY038]